MDLKETSPKKENESSKEGLKMVADTNPPSPLNPMGLCNVALPSVTRHKQTSCVLLCIRTTLNSIFIDSDGAVSSIL